MKINVLSSDSSDFRALTADITQYIDTVLFDSSDALLLAEHECDGILLDLDSNRKKIDKIIKLIRKSDQETPIIVLCNSLKGKNIQKHQKSRSGANIYFTYPMDLEVIRMTIEESFNSASPDDTRTVVLEVLKEHSEKTLSTKAQKASDKLDSVFSSSFFGDYSDRKAEEMKKKKEQDEIAAKEQAIEEIGLDEGLELSLDDELSLDTNEQESEDINVEAMDDLNLEMGEEDQLDLGSEASSDDSQIDLSGNDQELDLAMDSLDLQDNSDEAVSEEKEEDAGGLDLGGLDLPEFGDEELAAPATEDESLDLSPESIDLDADDESIDLGADDESIDLGADESLDLGVDFNIGSEEDDKNEDLGVSLSEEGKTSASQMFDLGKDDTSDGFDLSGEDNSDLEEVSISGMDESLHLSDGDDENLKSTGDLNEFDVTRPILQEELDRMTSLDEISIESNEETIEGLKLKNLNSTGTHENIGDILGEISAQAEQPIDDIETKIRQIDDLLKMDGKLEEDSGEQEDVTHSRLIENELNMEEEEDPLSFAEEQVEEVQAVTETPATTGKVRLSEISEHKEYIENHDIELIRLGETIKSLREDRERLVSKIDDMQSELQSDQKDYLSIQAELDEKKIEVSVVKKRASKQIDELNFKLDLASNKKEILEEQNKAYEEEFEKFRRSKKFDVKKVRSRERDLEEKLELLRSDAEVQIKNRDYKILDLKRRIDTLEFDIESAHIKEKKTVSNQQVLEDRMGKVIKTLRSAIGHLEDENSFEERKRLIKKNLDV